MNAPKLEDYVYLTIPPVPELRSCVGLVMSGMAARAKIGVGGLEEAVETLERFHSSRGMTRYRFKWEGEKVIAEVETTESDGWHTVAELVS